MITKLLALILGFLFYPAPKVTFLPEEILEFEQMYSEAIINKRNIQYSSIYPKYRFIIYIASTKPVLIHGSNNKQIVEFEPKKQTLFNGDYVDAVFATQDGIWAVFYAVFNRGRLVGNFRNACLRVALNYRFYFFSVTKETMAANPWTSGLVYFLPQESFKSVSHTIVFFDEWISLMPVKPIAKLEVDPDDFYFLNKVSCHKPNESTLKSWLFYKFRLKRGNS